MCKYGIFTFGVPSGHFLLQFSIVMAIYGVIAFDIRIRQILEYTIITDNLRDLKGKPNIIEYESAQPDSAFLSQVHDKALEYHKLNFGGYERNGKVEEEKYQPPEEDKQDLDDSQPDEVGKDDSTVIIEDRKKSIKKDPLNKVSTVMILLRLFLANLDGVLVFLLYFTGALKIDITHGILMVFFILYLLETTWFRKNYVYLVIFICTINSIKYFYA